MLLLVGPFAGLKSNSKLRSLRTISFFASYILFFLSWTFSDLAVSGEAIVTAGKIMRYAAYLCIGLNLLFIDRTKKEWVCFSAMFLLSAGYFFVTKEIFLLALTALVMISLDESISDVFKVSLIMLVGLVAVALALCGVGVLENHITIRGGADMDIAPRYALGFYHSNVLPLLLFYIFVYLGIVRKFQFHPLVLLGALALSVAVYILCDSRAAFFATLVLLGLYFVCPRVRFPRRWKASVYLLATNIIFVLALISLIASFLHLIQSPLLEWIDTKVFSHRFSMGYQKIVHQGLHFIHMISFEQYISDGIVVDNAYMSTMIRYGVISIVILGIINIVGCKKYKYETLTLMVFTLVCCVNFVDNDLLTYSCFPFLLAAANRNSAPKMYSFATRTSKELISVVMSTYNEKKEELCLSIESILGQTHENLEFIIVNDNPHNGMLEEVLAHYSQQDARVVVVKNVENLGLVRSLNRALSYVRGDYVARMDADDVAHPDRLKIELQYLKGNRLDFVGSWINWIDESGDPLNYTMKVPDSHMEVVWAIRWGNCVPHPTWLLKREVYDTLQGYRMIPSCEDYDFILRAIKAGYRVGNVPMVTLDYRIRQTGISESNKVTQTMTRYYLAANKRRIFQVSPKDVNRLVADKENRYYAFDNEKRKIKQALRGKKPFSAIPSLLKLLFNRNLYLCLIEKLWVLSRA